MDGGEILHQLIDALPVFIPLFIGPKLEKKNQVVQDFATIHHMYWNYFEQSGT